MPLGVKCTGVSVNSSGAMLSHKPAATRKQIEKALEMLNAAERPLIVAGGGVINADASDLLVTFFIGGLPTGFAHRVHSTLDG